MPNTAWSVRTFDLLALVTRVWFVNLTGPSCLNRAFPFPPRSGAGLRHLVYLRCRFGHGYVPDIARGGFGTVFGFGAHMLLPVMTFCAMLTLGRPPPHL